MNLSRDSVLALQRHFLGALTVPARTWLEPLPVARLAYAGSALRRSRDEWILDFGTVETPGEERRTVRVFLPGVHNMKVGLADCPPWLTARWIDDTTLELLAKHDAESVYRGFLRFVIGGDRIETLGVHMTTRRAHPVARFDFNGAPVARPYDFGFNDHAYQLSVANDASAPLVVSFADLPAWLTFEVDGHRRGGPLEGRFFERAAPFIVRIRPQDLGRHEGTLRMQTNDPRAALRMIDLHFAACIAPAQPFVRAMVPSRARLRAGQTLTTEIRLENWSRSAALTAKHTTPRGIAVPAFPTIPAAHDGEPGTAALPVRINSSQLAPGSHTLPLTLQISGGDPPVVDVPVRVDVLPADGRVTPWRAALLALLLLVLAVLLVRGLP